MTGSLRRGRARSRDHQMSASQNGPPATPATPGYLLARLWLFLFSDTFFGFVGQAGYGTTRRKQRANRTRARADLFCGEKRDYDLFPRFRSTLKQHPNAEKSLSTTRKGIWAALPSSRRYGVLFVQFRLIILFPYKKNPHTIQGIISLQIPLGYFL